MSYYTFELADLEEMAGMLRNEARDQKAKLDTLGRLAAEIDANGSLGELKFGEKIRAARKVLDRHLDGLNRCAVAVEKIIEEVRWNEEYVLRLKNGGWEQLLQQRFAEDTREVQMGSKDYSTVSLNWEYFGVQMTAKYSEPIAWGSLPSLDSLGTELNEKASKVEYGARIRFGTLDNNIHFGSSVTTGTEISFGLGKIHKEGEYDEGGAWVSNSQGGGTLTSGATISGVTVDGSASFSSGASLGGYAKVYDENKKVEVSAPVGNFGVGMVVDYSGESELPKGAVTWN